MLQEWKCGDNVGPLSDSPVLEIMRILKIISKAWNWLTLLVLLSVNWQYNPLCNIHIYQKDYCENKNDIMLIIPQWKIQAVKQIWVERTLFILKSWDISSENQANTFRLGRTYIEDKFLYLGNIFLVFIAWIKGLIRMLKIRTYMGL